jgi:hypothetical protein
LSDRSRFDGIAHNRQPIKIHCFDARPGLPEAGFAG